MSHIIGIIIGKALGNWQRIDAEGNSIAPAAGIGEEAPTATWRTPSSPRRSSSRAG